MRIALVSILAALALGLFVCSTAYAVVLSAGGGEIVQSWGKDNTQTYGQTITAPSENTLNSFSFWLGRTSTNYPDPEFPSLTFRAHVYEWDGSLDRATGSALYTSGMYTHNASPSTPFTQYTFNTGGLVLNSGSMYALFLSTSGLAGTGRIQWESATSDEYAGGSFVFLNNGENASLWTTDTWGSGYDLHFDATFSGTTPIPEPSTWILLISGLMTLGAAGLRRRQAGGSC